MDTVSQVRAWLIPMPGGPALAPLELHADPAGEIIGRHESCTVRLPADAEQVSRRHAQLSYDGQRWHVTDLESRWGTFLNGVKLPAHRPAALSERDLLRIVPWTFSFSTAGVPRAGLLSVDDSPPQTMIRSFATDMAKPLADDMLALLLEGATSIHAAESEDALAKLLLDIACRGTGLPNAAVLRPLDAGGHLQVVAARSGPTCDCGEACFSRSLLAVAAQGRVAELSPQSETNVSESIVQMRVDSALCVPLMLGGTVAAYLYVDSRRNHAEPMANFRTLRPNASGFCAALGKMAGLALANLKRIEIERRAATIDAELHAAATAQKWILPREPVVCGPFTCSGESRAGQYLGGDFFDAIALDNGRMAVALGDVSGHGIAASVLMTAAQGFLHASLAEHGDVAKAVNALNKFVFPRRTEGKFITLWVGVFDANTRTVTYVDAGHGYALLAHGRGKVQKLADGDGIPVGLDPQVVYAAATAALPETGTALILSDGLIEQSQDVSQTGGDRRQFDLAGVEGVLCGCENDDKLVKGLFAAVCQFAGTTSLADDATAVLMRW